MHRPRGITRSFLPICSSAILQGVLREAEQFASGAYATALGKGDSLSPQERQSILDQVTPVHRARPQRCRRERLRIKQWIFCHELLRSQRLTVGRLDSRFTGPNLSQTPKKAVLRPHHGGNPAAVYRDLQQLCSHRSGLQDRFGVQRTRWAGPSGTGDRQAADFPTSASRYDWPSSRIPT